MAPGAAGRCMRGEVVVVDLSGRRALVTGGGTGIGYGCAQRLVESGAQVTIAGRRADVLAEAAERLDGAVATVECDITDEAQVEAAVAAAAQGGNLDVLVANAGSGFPGAILQMGADAWSFCLQLNVVGTAMCIKHAGLVMKEHGGGSIVTISSTSGTKVQPWLAAYVTSKAGLDMMVKCAAIELAPHGIRVNSVQPGYVPTEVMAAAAEGPLHERLVRATPLGRAGEATDVGDAVAFLASDESAWVTGQVFGVDGGMNVPVMPSMASIAERLYGTDVVAEFAIPDLTALDGPGEVG
jgi:NAD(P)-dependent dehydrogenase (short-subunit alcohol dehydrogenase family)